MSRSHHPKLKPPPRLLFSCGIFRNCTQSVLSPTTPPSTAVTFLPAPPSSTPPHTPPPPPPPQSNSNPPPTAESDRAPQTSSSSSSSSSTSQSFTQWRFPLHHPHPSEPEPRPAPPPDAQSVDIAEAFHSAELHFSSGARLPALRLLERTLAQDAPPQDGGGICPQGVMVGVVAALRDPATARAAAKVLLALLLPEPNRRAAVNAGAATAAVDAVAASGPAGATAERALAALELLCTVAEGASEVRGHALAARSLAGAVEGMSGRGRECAIGVMAAIYGGERAAEAPPEVARAVVVALQGECSARGRRKGSQLLRSLQEGGRVDVAGDGC